MSDNQNTHTSPQLPPAGWYPDQHDALIQRYWDGAQWTPHTAAPTIEAVSAGAAHPIAGSVPRGTAVLGDAAGGASAVRVKRGLPQMTWWQWALLAFGVLVLLSIIIGGLNGGRASTDAESDRPAAAEVTQEAVAPAEEVVEMVEVPDLVGSTIAEARVALEAAGLVLVASGVGDDWIVTAQQPASGSHPAEGLELSVTSEAPEPVYSLAQQNAVNKARSYLAYAGFSRTGLIGQLEYEGYSIDDATFGADNAGADWNAEAAEKAASYLDYSAFSREGLYDQLVYEEFTPEQIEFALASVGY